MLHKIRGQLQVCHFFYLSVLFRFSQQTKAAGLEAAILQPIQLEIFFAAGIPSVNQESRPGLFQKNASMPPLVILTQKSGGSTAYFGLRAGRALGVPLCIGGHRKIVTMN